MKHLKLIAVLLTLSATAQAECYMRSTTLNELKARVERQTDVVREVRNINDKLQCFVTFRVMINGVWYTAQGRAVGDTFESENQLCAQAMDSGRARLLQTIKGSETSVTQEMVCTDQTIPTWKPVTVGQKLQESEVAPHPRKRASFPHKGTECRWFVETLPQGVGGLIQNEGIICRIRQEEWIVLEKWVNSVDK